MEFGILNDQERMLLAQIKSYRGNDPLHLLYELILSLSNDRNKEEVMKYFLEQTVSSYLDEYARDDRMLRLVHLLVKLDGCTDENRIKLATYMSEIGNYLEADYIYANSVRCRKSEAVCAAYRDFLMFMGQKSLKELSECPNKATDPKVDLQDKHDSNGIKSNQDKSECQGPVYPEDLSELDFDCPLAYFQPDDPKVIVCYPKSKVYMMEEYQLEEIMAQNYWKKVKSKERAKKSKLENGKAVENGPPAALPEEPVGAAGGRGALGARSPPAPSLEAPQPPPPLFPQLCQDISTSNQSFTVNTKKAIQVVQEMWNSPKQEFGFKVPEAPPPVKKPIPFQVFTDNESEPEPAPSKERGGSPLFDRGKDESDMARMKEMSDETCNTNFFKPDLGFPTSTPVGAKSRAAAAALKDQSSPSNGSDICEDYLGPSIGRAPPAAAQQSAVKTDLSVILEASQEKANSSAGSNASNNPKQSMIRIQEIELAIGNMEVSENPFSDALIQKLLCKANFPQQHHREGYHIVQGNLPNFTKTVRLSSESYSILGEVGKGAYARVLKASKDEKHYALKIEKPPCNWEFYIIREIFNRLPLSKTTGFMGVQEAFIYSNGSVLKSDFALYGNLLNVVNTYKKVANKNLEFGIVLDFAIQLVEIINYLHSCKIIHGDVKPDNFVLRHLPDNSIKEPWIQLIDFGRSIDMALLPPSTQFTAVVSTHGFTCNEMKEKKPWTYQTDLYGLAGTIHCILTSDYMKVIKKKSVWVIQKSIPRHMKPKLWEDVFTPLLNVESCERLPDLAYLAAILAAQKEAIPRSNILHFYASLNNMLLGK